jgi:ABC-type oligopeptide transport system ATPase subunit
MESGCSVNGTAIFCKEVIPVGLFYEADKTFEDLMKEKKNFVFIGEAGSGKSEIVLNIANKLAQQTGKKVDLFDLDQTKPLYRSRDMQEDFAKRGVSIIYQDQYLDAPVMVGGVRVSLVSDNYTLLDIGGGHQAAKFAGAYADLLSKDDAVPVYIINPYRPWTKSVDAIDGTMRHILGSMRLDHIYILGNPNLGYSTSVNEFMEGLDRIDELLDGFTVVNSACVRRDIYDEVRVRTDKSLIPLDLFLTYSWVD